MNYAKAYQLVSYVESLPPGTRFDYLNPVSCLFGHYCKSEYAHGAHSVDAIGHALEMDKWQVSWIYGGLLDSHEYGRAVQFDRLEMCRRARSVLAKWEAKEALALAAKHDKADDLYEYLAEVQA